MVWRIKSINHVAIPSHEGEWSYDTEATFENAVRDALADHRMQLILGNSFPTALSSMWLS